MFNRRIQGLAGLATGVAASVLILEGLLRLLPIQQGLNAADFSAAWPIERLEGPGRYTYSMDWDLHNVRHGRINAMGYPAPFDYVPGSPAIAVIGDSFVEGLMNDYADSLQARLQQTVGSAPTVMGFARSGTGLPDYLAMTRLAADRFRLEWLVILVVPGDFIEGFQPRIGKYHWSSTQPGAAVLTPDDRRRSGTRRWLRSLALVHYLKAHLGVSLHDLLFPAPVSPGSSQCRPAGLVSGDERIIENFIAALPGAAKLPASRIILVFDPDLHPGTDGRGLRGGRSACTTRDNTARAQLQDRARQAGLQVVDMKEAFEAYYRQTGERIDYADSHWNAAGHRLAAQAVSRILTRPADRGN